MSWARRRKLIYIVTIILVFLLVVVLPTILHFYKPATCTDGKLNQGEQGVDCGGPCNLLCNSQNASLNILWSRFSKVNDGVYNVLAYIENPNLNAEANNLTYVFKLYNNKGILLKERNGRTYAPGNKIITVFEPEMLTGNEIPQRVEFSFTSNPVWIKQADSLVNLSVSQSIISREDSAPRLTTVITNTTLGIVKNIEAVAIIYNADGNTIAFSRTIIDSLNSREAKEISFNWPKPFGETYARAEVVLKVLK